MKLKKLLDIYHNWQFKKLLNAGKLACGAELIKVANNRVIVKCACFNNKRGVMLTQQGANGLKCEAFKEALKQLEKTNDKTSS